MASVLIVDDEASVRGVLRRVAESAGHTVWTAQDSHGALQSLSNDPADVVMTDVHMVGPIDEGARWAARARGLQGQDVCAE